MDKATKNKNWWGKPMTGKEYKILEKYFESIKQRESNRKEQ